jgi:hypothetical protein
MFRYAGFSCRGKNQKMLQHVENLHRREDFKSRISLCWYRRHLWSFLLFMFSHFHRFPVLVPLLVILLGGGVRLWQFAVCVSSKHSLLPTSFEPSLFGILPPAFSPSNEYTFRVKVQFFLCLSTMPWGRMREWRWATCNRNLSTRWRWVVSFTVQPLYLPSPTQELITPSVP